MGGLVVAAGEIAIGKAHARDRAAEALAVGLIDLEARLDRQPAHAGAIGLPFDLQGAGWQFDMTDRPGTPNLDGTRNRAIRVDGAGTARAFEAVESEGLARDEMAGGVGIELLSSRRSRSNHASQYQRKTRTH